MIDPARSLSTFAIRMVGELEDALTDGPRFAALLAEVGWRVDVPPALLPALRDALGAGPPLAAAVAALRRFLSLPSPGFADVTALGVAAAPLVAALRGLGTVAGRFTDPPFTRPDFWAEVGRDLPALLFDRRLGVDAPALAGVLLVAGVIDRVDQRPDGPERLPYRRHLVDWAALREMITSPSDHLAARYGWGGELDHDRLLRTLETAIVALGVPARRVLPGPADLALWTGAAPASVRRLDVPLVEGPAADGSAYLELVLGLLPVPGAAGTAAGIALVPELGAGIEVSVALGPELTLQAGAAADLDGGVVAILLPDGARVQAEGLDGELELRVRLVTRPEKGSRVLLGEPGSHRLEMGEAWASLRGIGTLTAGGGDVELVAELGVADKGLALVLDFGRSDGFLHTVFGDAGQRLELGGALTWSSRNGLKLAGSAGLEVTLPIETTVGVVRIDAITLGVRAGDTGVAAQASVSGALLLGPMTVTVDRVGAQLRLDPGADGGKVGVDVDLAFGPKPPSGLGLALRTPVVTGGGFVLFDPEREQYAGLLHLEFAGVVAVTAVALLTTRMPDGSRGFSLFVLIAASGFAFQLGFGFTLTGLGGMLGINRAVNVDVLRDGMRTGVLDSVLFPQNPAENAPAIVNTLTTVFPAAPDHVVLGPMAELGWGPRSLLTVRIGLVFETPKPTRLILLARISARLPDPAAPVVSLNMDSIGVLDFDRGELTLDATLYDSRIAGFALSGDMAMRLGWGERPRFLLSIGGWHPRYAVTEPMPALRRLTLELSGSANPRLRFEAYLAVTSNSVQFGARAEVVVSAAGFTLEGRFGLDALIRFDPFGFVVDVVAALVVKRGSATLLAITAELTLSGPSPWRAAGSASFTLLFFSVSVSFDVTFGEAVEVAPPPAVPVQKLLQEALADRRSWAGELPAGAAALVSVGERAPEDTAVSVHPRGRLVLRQHVVPLGRTISTFGPSPVEGATTFRVEVSSSDGSPWLTGSEPVTDLFPPGDFDRLTDDQKLSAPAFVPMTSGMSWQASAVRAAPTVRVRSADPLRRVIDTAPGPTPAPPGPSLRRTVPERRAVVTDLGPGPAPGGPIVGRTRRSLRTGVRV